MFGKGNQRMPSTIYYFSSTGNSLAVAKKLQQRLDECELAPIASLINEKNIKPNGDTIGFVFPLYFFGIPLLIKDFLNELILDDVQYIFAVITKGGKLAGGAIPMLDKILKRKRRRLNSGFYITMPENYLPMLEVPKENEIQKQLNDCEIKIPKIAKAIAERDSIKEGALLSLLHPLIHNWWAPNVRNSDHRFWVEDTCINCGVCEQICPVNNIKMGQSKPEWLHHCEGCLACLHHCPKQAIQYGKNTNKKQRYRHPEILVAEITAQKKK